MKLTEYFPPHVKPMRSGVYKTRHYAYNGFTGLQRRVEGYSMWLADHWCYTERTPSLARKQTHGSIQNKEWCGLAEEPK